MEVSSAEFAYHCRIAGYGRELMVAGGDARKLHLLHLLAQENREARARGFSALVGAAAAVGWRAAKAATDQG